MILNFTISDTKKFNYQLSDGIFFSNVLCITNIANSWLSLCSGLFLSNQQMNKLTLSIGYDHEKMRI